MKGRLFCIIVALAFSFGTGAETADQFEQEIRVVLQKFAEAFSQSDVDALQKLIADDYVHTNLDGSVLNKTQWLDFAKVRKGEMSSGKMKFTEYRFDDIQVRIYGNTAVVTGKAVTAGVKEGKTFKSDLRFTNVWVRRENRWQRVAFHDSPISPK
jgi:uncharacterized protein (TIGR02246 family)